jgi:hypothetical protein
MGQMQYYKETIVFIALVITITSYVLFGTSSSCISIFNPSFIKDLFSQESKE